MIIAYARSRLTLYPKTTIAGAGRVSYMNMTIEQEGQWCHSKSEYQLPTLDKWVSGICIQYRYISLHGVPCINRSGPVTFNPYLHSARYVQSSECKLIIKNDNFIHISTSQKHNIRFATMWRGLVFCVHRTNKHLPKILLRVCTIHYYKKKTIRCHQLSQKGYIIDY